MDQRKIKTELVSFLGFGCMRFPVLENGRIDRRLAGEMLDHAYEQGVTYYDTAYLYHDGESEEFLGEWLKTKDRNSVLVATKLPMWNLTTTEDAERIFAEQLDKLQLDYVDFYLLHSLDRKKWDKARALAVLSFLDRQKAAGKVRYCGFSFHDDYAVFKEIIEAYPWDFTQIQINYMDGEVQAGLQGLKLARDLDIPVIVMEPVKGGLLADLPPKEKEMLDTTYSAAAMALRWVGSLDGVNLILSGMSTLDQLQDNLNVFSDFVPCTAEEKEKITAVAISLNEKVLVPCSSCNYCQPCPFDVDIPGCFKYLNIAERYENDKLARRNYEFNVAEHKAGNCCECLACLEKCPQNINIPEMLKIVAERLED